ncbi:MULTISPECIES: class I SAM-dependent methyltransferase [Actinomadura]|uniref:Class I SAM-dependent methyltransferase n=1 Tax=Actinomadura yumaensis TaxID=111807 RepID=A0ABW2CXA1_9ACTN|nr:class I SAM-dependent methyltransferase [Actinomadura sp. J1-007]MWK39503.1 methyltransferase domain-containing protein [Actinomadura sp. J1-007]
MADEDYRTLNRALWDERVPIHFGSAFYDVEGFRQGAISLRGFELREVGDVAGRRMVHLQCHFGLDTLSWARRGALMTGLDFSGPAVEAARRLAVDAHLPARFVQADVYDAVAALGATYEIVYTGLGSLVWLPDVARWASVVAALLEPGGFLYLSEFHPFADILDDAEGRMVEYDYFDRGPHVWDEKGTYTGEWADTEHTRSVQFQHGVGEVVSALTGAGLRVEFLHEHDFTLFPRYESMERDGATYRLPKERPRLPLMYSLRATRPSLTAP